MCWVPSLASLDKQHFTITSDYEEYKYLTSTAMNQYCVRADLSLTIPILAEGILPDHV